MTKDIEIFRNCCVDLLKLIEIRENIDPTEIFSIMIHKGRYFHYEPKYRTKLTKLVDHLLKNKQHISELYNRNYLFRTINEFILDLKISKEPNKTLKMDEFFNSSDGLFKEINPFIVTLQIVNLKLDSNFSIGDVEFIPYSREAHKNIYTNVGASSEHLDDTLYQINDDEVTCVAKVEVSAGDADKACDLADYSVEGSLDVLRVYLGNTDFGTRGSLKFTQMIASACNTKTKSMFLGLRNNYTKFRVNSNLSRIENFRNNHGLSNVDNILKSRNKNELEANLIISIKFLSEILKDLHYPQNIVKLFTCVEALLINNEEKENNLARRLAVINYSAQEDRNRLYKLVRDMYRERNKLVHEGLTNNGLPHYDENKFFKLFVEVRSCVINIAKMMNQHNDLLYWIEFVQNENYQPPDYKPLN